MPMNIDALTNNLSNPARSYMFEVLFPQIPGGGNAEDLEIRGFSSSIPGRGVGGINLPFKGTAGMKVPGKVKMDQSWKVAFREGTDASTFDSLYGWFQFIMDAKTGVGTPDPLTKTTIYLHCLDLEGNAWLKLKLVGCYIETMDEIPVSFESEEVVVFNVTFSYDRWEKV